MSRADLRAQALLSAALLLCCLTGTTAATREVFAATEPQVQFGSVQPPHSVARCFDERANLLPGSRLSFRPDDGSARYVLGIAQFLFEEIRFEPDRLGATQITVRLAPELDARWRRDFERDRLAPLRLCAGEAS